MEPKENRSLSQFDHLDLLIGGAEANVALGPIVVPFGGSYLESHKVIPKRNHYGAVAGAYG